MPYDPTCKRCRFYGKPGKVTLWRVIGHERCENEGHDPEELVDCPDCKGTAKVRPVRRQLTMDESDGHGWKDVPINSWHGPKYDGRKGHCKVCDRKLIGRQTVWCDDRWCKGGWHQRFYVNVHWTKRHVVVRDGCVCQSCGLVSERPIRDGGKAYPYPQGLELDHIVPLSKGGSDGPDNLQLLCSDCHMDKTVSERKRPEKVAQTLDIR